MTEQERFAALEAFLAGAEVSNVELAQAELVSVHVATRYHREMSTLTVDVTMKPNPPAVELENFGITAGYMLPQPMGYIKSREARGSGRIVAPEIRVNNAIYSVDLKPGTHTGIYLCGTFVQVGPGHYKMWTKQDSFRFTVS